MSRIFADQYHFAASISWSNWSRFLGGLPWVRYDLSVTSAESVGDSFCEDCQELREVLLPPGLKMVRRDFLGRAAVEGVDLSEAAVENLCRSFCSRCPKLCALRFPPRLRWIGYDCLSVRRRWSGLTYLGRRWGAWAIGSAVNERMCVSCFFLPRP
jgi:hypothetical protein